VPETAEPIVDALVRRAREVGLAPILVGDAQAYADLAPGVPRVPDAPAGIGPLGGLAAALAAAGDRTLVTVACDMPHAGEAVLRRLLDAPGRSPVLAPRHGDAGPWEPLLARWDPPRVRPALAGALEAGERSFQRLLERLDPDVLPIDADIARALEDWDRPEDLSRPW